MEKLSGEQQKALQELKEKLKNENWPEGFDSSDASLIRFLKGSKFNIENTKKIVMEALSWWITHRPDKITPDQIPNEVKADKAYWHGILTVTCNKNKGKDKKGRPILIFRASRHFPESRVLSETFKYTLYVIQQGIELMKETGVEQYVMIYDRTDFQRKNFDIEMMKKLSEIGKYFPERLGAIYIVKPNWLFHVLYAVVTPFMDPATREKIKLLKWNPKDELLQTIDEDQLLTDYGGKAIRTSQVNENHVQNEDTSDLSVEEMFLKMSKEAASMKDIQWEHSVELYGLYQQVTVGDINEAQPWAVQYEARAKWEAWNKYKGTEKELAMEKYIQYFIDVVKK